MYLTDTYALQSFIESNVGFLNTYIGLSTAKEVMTNETIIKKFISSPIF
tara:strand:+ start:235 stop:381 length:147 start_codon:yes stop_codon:yes gene_type:complete